MEDYSKYLAMIFKSLGYKVFVFKNIWMLKSKKKYIFTEEELAAENDESTKCMIAGLSNGHNMTIDYLTSSREGRSMPFQYEWTSCGTYEIPIEDLSNDAFKDMLNAMFIQMMLKLENKENIKIGNSILFKKGTAFEVMINADLNPEGIARLV